eukprot:1995977-Pleurochrysis_carterae.AAC.1
MEEAHARRLEELHQPLLVDVAALDERVQPRLRRAQPAEQHAQHLVRPSLLGVAARAEHLRSSPRAKKPSCLRLADDCLVEWPLPRPILGARVSPSLGRSVWTALRVNYTCGARYCTRRARSPRRSSRLVEELQIALDAAEAVAQLRLGLRLRSDVAGDVAGDVAVGTSR